MDVTVWTGVGTPRAPMANPLVDLCLKEDVQMLAVRLPGRSVRSHEPVPATIQECAAQLLEVIEPLVSLALTPGQKVHRSRATGRHSVTAKEGIHPFTLQTARQQGQDTTSVWSTFLYSGLNTLPVL